ncbi:hypothetical protein BT67DRAFT_257826 [Trichocladium antarcticum]|uniref:Uncharacterized protein n=1 Tax=Trichocladium antarcticum TaxID=1450529 RepID=A0AAN6UN14_9PEZI|nr:hypothetical protein BT67DRAFT_257826 [Trichocladium antarcticum]
MKRLKLPIPTRPQARAGWLRLAPEAWQVRIKDTPALLLAKPLHDWYPPRAPIRHSKKVRRRALRLATSARITVYRIYSGTGPRARSPGTPSPTSIPQISEVGMNTHQRIEDRGALACHEPQPFGSETDTAKLTGTPAFPQWPLHPVTRTRLTLLRLRPRAVS